MPNPNETTGNPIFVLGPAKGSRQSDAIDKFMALVERFDKFHIEFVGQIPTPVFLLHQSIVCSVPDPFLPGEFSDEIIDGAFDIEEETTDAPYIEPLNDFVESIVAGMGENASYADFGESATLNEVLDYFEAES